jgi:DNA-binding transcriptional regulator GbsR (MarR family)
MAALLIYHTNISAEDSIAYKRFIKDPGQLCFDYKAKSLKNLQTAQIVNVSLEKDSITVIYKTMDEFGAYGNDIFKCALDHGEFSQPLTVLREAQEQIKNVEECKALRQKELEDIEKLILSCNTPSKCLELNQLKNEVVSVNCFEYLSHSRR